MIDYCAIAFAQSEYISMSLSSAFANIYCHIPFYIVF